MFFNTYIQRARTCIVCKQATYVICEVVWLGTICTQNNIFSYDYYITWTTTRQLYLLEPLIAGSTLEVRSATGMNPFPVASGAAESYRRIFENRIAETHGFQAYLRLSIKEGSCGIDP